MQKDPENKKEDFLTRWSRRKSASVTREADGNPALHLDNALLTPSGQTLPNTPAEVSEYADDADRVEKKTLTDEDMPDIHSLNEQSDYSVFMSEGVSRELRKLALRKLFSGVGFNVRDGLDDYDDDFRGFTALGDLVTSDMKHQMEMAEKRKKEEQEANADETVERELTNERQEPTQEKEIQEKQIQEKEMTEERENEAEPVEAARQDMDVPGRETKKS